MFQDNEPLSVMTSTDRQFEVAKIIRVRAITADTIEIANFAPTDITDASILMTVSGMPTPLHLLHIKAIRAHAIQKIRYPFMTGTAKCLNTNNQEVDMSSYKTTGIPPANASFDFDGETDLIKKLKKIDSIKWVIRFNDYNTSQDPASNWKIAPTAKDFRRYTGLFINMAYHFMNDSLERLYVDEPITENDGVTFITADKKKTLFQKYKDISFMKTGVVTHVDGLGGGSVFGVGNSVLGGYLSSSPCFITIHEMGHMLGYGHTSTMTYPKDNHGAVVPTGRVWSAMLTANDFPIQKNNYYKPTDLQ
ncbi:hypothetical protein [Chitinophaga eiseniae]|uniref:Uncharacterized protein n=1 Tax=Chitinophaga eiseniae TaxID=634771 RepID=A0A847SGP9_9BACT|nr:hypothetical protein [Chitinophaga eiseniae]NLR77977.1 hypothetical protein [Chitinophaga eiseniae]